MLEVQLSLNSFSALPTICIPTDIHKPKRTPRSGCARLVIPLRRHAAKASEICGAGKCPPQDDMIQTLSCSVPRGRELLSLRRRHHHGMGDISYGEYILYFEYCTLLYSTSLRRPRGSSRCPYLVLSIRGDIESFRREAPGKLPVRCS